jgi:PAS domain S-box-containing protein
MRQDYLRQLPAKLQQVRDIWSDCLASDQPEQPLVELRRLVHNLAGSGATFGCAGVSAAAADIEAMLKDMLENPGAPVSQHGEQMQATLAVLDVALDNSRTSADVTAEVRAVDAPALAPTFDEPARTLYLVEDDEHFARMFSSRVAPHGYATRVLSGAEALRGALAQMRPAAIVTDMILPTGELAGAQIIRELNHGDEPPVPVLFVSIRGDFEARLQAARAGATHYFTKPVDFDALLRVLGELPGERPRDPYRVLYVDDDPALAELYRAHLEQAGMTVATVTNPLLAMDVLRQFAPDLILLDVYMPHCSGLELASVIRQHEEFDLIPILFLSTEWNMDRKLATLNLSTDDFLTKPVESWRLVNTLQARIRRARSIRRGTVELRASVRELGTLQFALDQHAIVSMADAAGNITYVNNKFCQVSGYRREELLGKNHRVVKSGAHSQDLYDKLWASIASGKVWHGELRNRKKDGTPYWVETTIVPVLDDFGVPQRYISIRTEVTRLKQAEAALRANEERLQRSQSYANIGTWDWDIGSGEFHWSERIAPLFGGPHGKLETTYENFLDAVHPDDRQYVIDSVNACVEQGAPYDIEHRVVWPDGMVRWLKESGDVVRAADGTPLHMLGVVQEITHRKQAEEELILAREEAERANRAKSEFLSSMSHELRTPMNVILGFAQLLEADTSTPLAPSQQEDVQQILKAGAHLLTLINEVLDLARIESGKIDLSIESVCAADVLRECSDLVEPLARQRGIRIVNELGASFNVQADRTRLRQALINLLSNAVKYNRENGTIRCSAERRAEGMVRIGISDTGVGLTAAQQQGLFQAFNRLGAESTAVEGTGIGLALTRDLVELMGGNIGVKSVVGEGSTFWVELHAGQESAPRDGGVESHDGAVAKHGTVQKTVLYVEDNPANLRLVAQILSRCPEIHLITAHTAELGLDLARARQPQLMILDLNLPGMSGYELRAQLRLFDETRNIPCMALSANALPKDIERGLAAGFERYLTKPLQVEEFARTVRQFLVDSPAQQE